MRKKLSKNTKMRKWHSACMKKKNKIHAFLDIYYINNMKR